MEDKFFPKIFTIADDKSKSSQNRFINLNKISLILIVVFAISSIFTYSNQAPSWLIFICTVAVILSTLINIYILFGRPEKKWYEGRAIAESVKTLAWKYMIGSQPFILTVDQMESDSIFKESLKKIVKQDEDFLNLIGDEKNENYIITEKMKEIRASSYSNRKNIYLNDRIQNQIDWYSKKTKDNRTYKNRTLYAIIGFQILAVILFSIENFCQLEFSLTSFLITVTTVFMTWLQMKRYQELTDAYGVTAKELIKIKQNADNITNDEDLNKYVDDSETAISREHTLWIARRDNVELYD